ncbi:MAG: acetyl-coenzyme A synthetase N-terminal domain-containing protein, partial [Tabrizicola sp.]
MSEAAKSIYPPSSDFAAKAHVDAKTYEARYAASIQDPEAFWGAEGQRIDWIKPYTRVKNTSFEMGSVSI